MKTFGVTTLLAAASFFSSAVLADVDPIVIKGSKFFYKTNGTQFYIKGVAYQQDYSTNGSASTSDSTTYIDPLSSSSNCARDIPYLKQLGTNVIRTYAIDPTVNHDACMSMLAAAGIYVISDLSAPGYSINRDTPAWNEQLYARYTAVIDNLQKYNNVMGFFAGNEVSNNASNTDASAFVKAAVRDMKSYIKAKGYRSIGVGYATNDDAGIRENLADYFDCGDSSSAIDFWGYNIYSWCGDSSYSESGYDQRTAEFKNYNVPVFFAEYGCNEVRPRTFTEVSALFGPQMSPVWSGGIVYMYFQEQNNYGLVSVDGSSVSTLSDFNYLSSQIAQVTVSGVNSASYTPTNTAAQACPSVNSAWEAASKLPPTPNSSLCACMYNALTCVPKSGLSDTAVGSLFGTVCGFNDGSCNGIIANGTSGNYGAYGMCNSTEQLGWVLNAYYNKQSKAGNGASACNFGGSATTKAVVTPTGTCASLLSQAGNGGTGTVAATGSSGSSSSSHSAANGHIFQSVQIGYLHVGAYLIAAVGSGMAMILL